MAGWCALDERLKDLYRIPKQNLPQDVYLLELAEHCAYLEERVRVFIEGLPEEDRVMLESYLDVRDELEYQSVKTALRFSKYVR